MEVDSDDNQEPQDQEPQDSQTSQISQHEYNEPDDEDDEEDDQDMTMDDEPSTSEVPTSSNMCMIDDGGIEEPSPIDRRLTEGRSFNDGDWSSEELKKLFDGLHKYGTQKFSMAYIKRNILEHRPDVEIKTKLFEIRDMVSEHKEDVMDFYKKKWLTTGHRNIRPPPGFEVDEDLTWAKAIDSIQRHHHKSIPTYKNPTRTAIVDVLKDYADIGEVEESVKVTDMQTARASSTDTQTVRWQLIYKFMAACVELKSRLPPLNELEAAIVTSVLDSIEDEAAGMSDNDKAVMNGMFTECQIRDFRNFEQDHPCTDSNAFQIYFDPLRTRAFNVPEGGTQKKSTNQFEDGRESPEDLS